MSSTLRLSLHLPKKFFVSSSACSLKSCSFSSLHSNRSSKNDTNKLFYQKINKLKPLQNRYYSLENPQSFYDSIVSSDTSKLLKHALVEIHDFTGLPWSVTIITFSVIMKLLITLPSGIYQQHLGSRLLLIKIELDDRIKSLGKKVLSEAIKEKWTKKEIQTELRKEVREQWTQLVVKNNCHPFKITVLQLLQFPFWLLLTVTIRSLVLNAAESGYPVAALQLQVGGLFWFPNLSLPDPLFILPTLNLLSLLACTELSILSINQSKVAPNKQINFVQKALPFMLRLFAVMFFFISAASPSGLSLFWTSSSLFALAQNLLLMSPKMRRFFRIPKTPYEAEKPFSETWTKFVEKLDKLSNYKVIKKL